MTKYICPVAKTCKSTECECRVPHDRVKSKNHDHREFNCSALPPYCPACEEYDEARWTFTDETDKVFAAYYQDISEEIK